MTCRGGRWHIFILLACIFFHNAYGHVSLQGFDSQNQRIFLTVSIVADRGKDQAYIESSGIISPLGPITHMGLALVSIPVRCETLRSASHLHYRVNEQVIASLPLDGVACTQHEVPQPELPWEYY